MLRPFFSFYGGKWRDTPKRYPKPEYQTIVEPFAGSAGYSMRYADRGVILFEIDPVIAAVWKYLIHVKPREILAIPDLPSEGHVDDLDICEEARWLVGFWLNTGTASPRKRPSKWMRNDILPGSYWGERVRNTIARQVESIRHWKVYNESYDQCGVSGPATWFVDPPYQRAGKHYKFGASQIDYKELAGWCKVRQGQVIVCENDGADWLPFESIGNTKTTRAGKRSEEAVWLS